MSESEKQADTYDIGSILNRDRAILNAIEEGTFYERDYATGELTSKDFNGILKTTEKQDIISKRKKPQKILINIKHNESIGTSTNGNTVKNKQDIIPIVFDNLTSKYSGLIGLDGASYISTNNMAFYHMLSNLLKDNFIISNSSKIDLRIPLLILLKAGYGKLNYERFIKDTVELLGLLYSEQTSYHPEQFIGKIVVKEHKSDDNEYILVPGCLASYQIVVDEGKDLLTCKIPTYEQTLKYIRYALDPIGSHQLVKKQVNVPVEEQLQYYTEVNICILSQPISNIDEELLTRGSFRRFAICCPNIDQSERVKARKDITLSANTDTSNDDLWINWKEYTESIKGQKYELIFDCLNTIDDYIDTLLLDSSSYDSGDEYTDSLQFNLKYLIAKMAAIRAIVRQPNNDIVTVTIEDAEGAILDHKPTWKDQLQWINRQLILNSDKPIGWKDDLHGWIMEGLTQCPEGITNTKFNELYCKKYKGDKSEGTLKQYIYRALKDLKKWDMVKSTDTGIKNGKLFTLKKCDF